MVRQSLNKYSTLIRRLLPACEYDISLAKRQLGWMKDKIISDRTPNSTNTSSSLTVDELGTLDTFITQRVEQHKPLQYILGTQPFYDLDIITRPPTLIPRWETEEWTNRLVELLGPNWTRSNRRKILDVCTGTGCIALALATHLPNTDITGLDISPKAIQLANDNLVAHQHLLKDSGNKVRFQLDDIYEPQVERHFSSFDLVVSNPPYVTHDEYTSLDPDVKQWEDRQALVADLQGTQLHRRLIQLVSRNKQQQSDGDLPTIVMEIGGEHQVPVLQEQLDYYGFNNIKVWKDLAGKDRVVLAT
ncbi:S-adenosyl-L-methionine-dependent methyltransferase [Chlamydoabsidia padenii]|nr:S-adenosyl-L-methionine-dependent methyltransferase [Chlamydoabsidia padenii]